MAGPLEEAMKNRSGMVQPIHGPNVAEVMEARRLRDADAAEQAQFTRLEVARRLRLRCVELALQAQTQNASETLTTEQLKARIEMLYDFVNGSGSAAANGSSTGS